MPVHVSSTCAHHQYVKLSQLVHGTATYMCDDTRGCVMQFWPPDDEHMCSKHVEAWNKLIVKQKFCASSRLITEINIWRDVTSNSLLWKGYEENIDYPTSWRRVLEENKQIIRRKKRSTLILVIAQQDATQSSLFIILQVHSTCFGCQPRPSWGVHKTVTTASGTGHIFYAAASLQRGQASFATGAVVTVLCTPHDGCGWHTKHVEWTCRIINRLFSVASCWTIINRDLRCTEP